MPPRVQIQVKREGAGVLVAELKKMQAAKAKPGRKLTEFEQAVITFYELFLYRLTDQLSPADAAMVEAAALQHREPTAQQLPYVPDA